MWFWIIAALLPALMLSTLCWLWFKQYRDGCFIDGWTSEKNKSSCWLWASAKSKYSFFYFLTIFKKKLHRKSSKLSDFKQVKKVVISLTLNNSKKAEILLTLNKSNKEVILLTWKC